MTVNINAGNISGIRLAEQGSDPSTPASGFGQLYAKADGLYFIGDDGVVEGPVFSPVAAKYNTAAAQTIPSSTGTVINFGTEEYDTHDAVTVGSSWRFTVPAGMGGIYSVSAAILFVNTTGWAAGESTNLQVHKNGGGGSFLARFVSQTTGVDQNVGVNGQTDIQADAGDLIDVRVQQFSGANLALINSGSWCHISIHRVA